MGKLHGVYYIIKGFVALALNAQFVDWYYQLLDYVAGRTTVYCYIENNSLQNPFFQQVLKPLVYEENKKRHTELHICEDVGKKAEKATRIEASLEPIDRNGQWVFNEREADNPHMQELRTQFQLFEMTMPYPAEGPDCIEGALSILRKKTTELQPPVTVSYKELNENNPYRM